MSGALAWGLVALAVAAGYVGYGWPGVLLAFTVTIFWLLMQFSRAVRVMKHAASRPVGHVANAVMLQSRLHKGMPLAQVINLTASLARRCGDEPEDPETWAWRDEAGDEVVVELQAGKLSAWRLQRAEAPADPA